MMKQITPISDLPIVDTAFGMRYDITNRVIDAKYDGVVLAVQTGYQYTPIQICLPHQVYVKTVDAIKCLHPNQNLVIIPIVTDDMVGLKV